MPRLEFKLFASGERGSYELAGRVRIIGMQPDELAAGADRSLGAAEACACSRDCQR